LLAWGRSGGGVNSCSFLEVFSFKAKRVLAQPRGPTSAYSAGHSHMDFSRSFVIPGRGCRLTGQTIHLTMPPCNPRDENSQTMAGEHAAAMPLCKLACLLAGRT
jgi:hypothetical protein